MVPSLFYLFRFLLLTHIFEKGAHIFGLWYTLKCREIYLAMMINHNQLKTCFENVKKTRLYYVSEFVWLTTAFDQQCVCGQVRMLSRL